MAASNVPYPCIGSANVGESSAPVLTFNTGGLMKLKYCQEAAISPEIGLDEDAGTVAVPAVFTYYALAIPPPLLELRITFSDATTLSLWSTTVVRVAQQAGVVTRTTINMASVTIGTTAAGEVSVHLIPFTGTITVGKTITAAELRLARSATSIGAPLMGVVVLKEPLASYYNGTDATKPLDNVDLFNDLQTTTTYVANPPPTCSHTVQSVVRRTVTIRITGGDEAGLASGSITWGDGQTTTLTSTELTSIRSGSAVTKTHTYAPAGGTFGVSVTLIDTGGASTTSTPTSVVVSPNTAPTCAFTATVQDDNRTVVLNATASADPDGTITAWRYRPDVEGAPTSWQAGVLGQPATYAYPAHGVYILEVEVTDNEGAVDTQQVILDLTNVPPYAHAVLQRDGQTVTLTDLSFDVDGTVATCWVTWGDGSLAEAITPGSNPTHAFPQVEETREYPITLTAIDDDGATDDWTGTLLIPGPQPPDPVEDAVAVAPQEWAQSPGIVILERRHVRQEG